MTPLHCESCGHTERDPIMLDTETCSVCGGVLAAFDDDDGQPTEAEEWRDLPYGSDMDGGEDEG